MTFFGIAIGWILGMIAVLIALIVYFAKRQRKIGRLMPPKHGHELRGHS